MKATGLTQPLLEPILSPVMSQIIASTGTGIVFAFPLSGDYLLTARGGDYLTDELNNRLTA